MLGYGRPRAERDGTRKSAAKRQRTGNWPEESAPRQASKAAWELRPSEGSPEREQQDKEDNNEGAQGDQGNSPGQINKKDNIMEMKMP